MSLFDVELAGAPKSRPCLFCAHVARLSKAQRADLERALSDRKYPATIIARVLERWSVLAKPATVTRHRPGARDACRTKYPEAI